MYIQNVLVCAGTTRTCVSTCARGAGTHRDVSNVHTVAFWIYTRVFLDGHTESMVKGWGSSSASRFLPGK